jgi:hypothetical protein
VVNIGRSSAITPEEDHAEALEGTGWVVAGFAAAAAAYFIWLWRKGD